MSDSHLAASQADWFLVVVRGRMHDRNARLALVPIWSISTGNHQQVDAFCDMSRPDCIVNPVQAKKKVGTAV